MYMYVVTTKIFAVVHKADPLHDRQAAYQLMHPTTLIMFNLEERKLISLLGSQLRWEWKSKVEVNCYVMTRDNMLVFV